MTVQDIERLNTAFEQFKTVNEQLAAEVKANGAASSETKTKLDALNGRLDSIETAITTAEAERQKHQKLAEKLDQLEALLNKKTSFAAGGDETNQDLALRKSAFFKALKNAAIGVEVKTGFTPDEVKALTLSTETTGGFLAPPEYVAEMITNIVEFSNVRPLCRIRSTSRPSVQFPKRTGTAAAAWVKETGTRSETTNPSYGMEEIPTHEMYGLVKVSKQDLEDAVFDLEAFLQEELSEQFGLSEGLAFISGNAVGKPEGMLTNASVSYTANGHATELQADGLISIYYDVKEPYLINSHWVMSRSTLKTVRQLKDGTGQYLWTPGIKTDARPATILDRPYITAPDMPTVGAGTFPILFGDFRRAYMIVDRLVMEMMTDPYSSKSTGMVEFSARRRVGGQVILPEAIRKLKISAS